VDVDDPRDGPGSRRSGDGRTGEGRLDGSPAADSHLPRAFAEGERDLPKADRDVLGASARSDLDDGTGGGGDGTPPDGGDGDGGDGGNGGGHGDHGDHHDHHHDYHYGFNSCFYPFGWYSYYFAYSWPFYWWYWYRPWPFYNGYYPYGFYPYGYVASYPVVEYTNVVYETYQEPAGGGYVEDVAASPAPVRDATDPDPHARAADRYLELGDRAFREGRYGDAVQFYAKAVEFSPDEGVLYLVLSDALFATGDYHYAAYTIRKALELDPTLVDAPVDKRRFYADGAEFDHQLATLERFVDDRVTDQDARLVLALNYLFAGRAVDSVVTLESPFAATLRTQPAAALVLESARRQVAEAAR